MLYQIVISCLKIWNELHRWMIMKYVLEWRCICTSNIKYHRFPPTIIGIKLAKDMGVMFQRNVSVIFCFWYFICLLKTDWYANSFLSLSIKALFKVIYLNWKLYVQWKRYCTFASLQSNVNRKDKQQNIRGHETIYIVLPKIEDSLKANNTRLWDNMFNALYIRDG